MKFKAAPVVASDSVRRPTSLLWISVFLFFVVVQMLISMVLFTGVFILSSEVLISPFHFCLVPQHGELSCKWWSRNAVSGAESYIKTNILPTVVTLALYVPVVLVAFALLALLLASYAKDRGTLWLSVACQAASSLLILTGIIGFLVINSMYVSWENMTVWFYLCGLVPAELMITSALSCVTARRLTSGWE